MDTLNDVLISKINECAKKANYPFLGCVNSVDGSVREIGCWDDVSYWVIKTDLIIQDQMISDDAMWLTGC